MYRIGRYAEGKGGIYAGIIVGTEFDSHVYLYPQLTQRDLIWTKASKWANETISDGHQDFNLPTCRQGALLFANLKDRFPDLWFWICELYPPDMHCAWVQTFGYGRQADARLTDACRACAVRTERCE